MKRGIGAEDAIGKYHEAVTVERLSAMFPTASDVSTVHYADIKSRFYPLVRHVAVDIERVAIPTVREMLSFMAKQCGIKPGHLRVKSYQLASESYRKNRLDSTDIIVEAGTEIGLLRQFPFSLKAVHTEGVFPCFRNPGLKQLVKKQYFDCGNIDADIETIRTMFHDGDLDELPPYRPSPDSTNRHSNALVLATEALWEHLRNAPTEALIKGITALVGNVTLVVANYGRQDARCESIPFIRPPFEVSVAPTPINVSINWNKHNTLVIRSKFASGTSKEYLHRWSSLKAAVTLHMR